MGISHYLAMQARRPSGLIGRIIGWFFVRGNRKANDFAFDFLEIGSGHQVLEIGFGPGAAIRRMAHAAADGKIVGIDFSKLMLEKASTRNRRLIEKGRVELRLGDVCELNFEPNSFDRIVGVNVLYFWQDPLEVLRKLHSVLKPGGRIVLYVTDRVSLSKMKMTGTGVFTLYDCETGVTLLEEAGYSKVRAREREFRDHVGICLIGEK